jgi:mannosylglycoprotein endo-beta-mannosidase
MRRGGSPFWRSLHKIKHYFKLGAKFSVGNDTKIRFWTDLWIGDFPLSSRFVRLFQISADPQGLVSQFYRDGTWNIRFRRSFGVEEQDSWDELLAELREVHISDSDDSVSWNLEPSGTFSTKSLYQRMIQGASVAHAKDVWKAACPLKVRILIWQLARDRLPSNAQIKRRHGNSDDNCVLCHVPEDAAHIFFNCPICLELL